LRHKKYREIHGLFLAEGEKIVLDIMTSPHINFQIINLLANDSFLRKTDLKKFPPGIEIIQVSDENLRRISSLSTPNNAILVCARTDSIPEYRDISETLSVYLEDIRDPGNLGTIIRTADWFGVKHIFCSNESVDIFNPKVIQSSMGSVCRVRVYYDDPDKVLSALSEVPDYKFYGTSLEGRSIYREKLDEKGMIFFGNESRGLTAQLLGKLDVAITIPAYGGHIKGSESLNIASAASIVLAEFRRRGYSK
jgi:TrmH family RNA methyltransferase